MALVRSLARGGARLASSPAMPRFRASEALTVELAKAPGAHDLILLEEVATASGVHLATCLATRQRQQHGGCPWAVQDQPGRLERLLAWRHIAPPFSGRRHGRKRQLRRSAGGDR
eukprot:scaffold71920_cov45-Phaeocystis_antarctica.AAC.2